MQQTAIQATPRPVAQPTQDDLTQAVNTLVNAMTPAELQDIVDLSDVRYDSDRAFLAQWKRQVATAIIVGARMGDDWALEAMA